ncbi:MAG: zinc-dependent metalloprotease [Paludisphaera borealis]|uniref:zinc-dependent metalloprotease n=1 Tax=Paludisphaera borealis TaxID=1387353 RepID=UPI0028500FB1|nr:zinc-dependent metalloprotease [Paludisphaera borealis]MDR3617812.1 zinc-dependent metalloprotease [Paludisphaera borealis]
MSRNGRQRWIPFLSFAALAAVSTSWAQEAAKPVPNAIDIESILAASRGGSGGSHGGSQTKFRDFNEVTKDAEKIEGLFTLHKTGDHLYAEIRPDQFNQTLLVPVTIARGMANAGMPVGDDDLVIVFRRVGDRVQVVRRNIHYKAPAGTPLDKAVKQNYTDSVIMALPIQAINMMRGGAVLIDLSDIFMTDFAQLGIGPVDRSRSSWQKVKGFADNMELELEATYGGSGRRGGYSQGDDGVADARGLTLVIHYSLMRTPDAGYRSRQADDRVGYFLTASKDFGSTSPDSNFVRNIYRWRLEKADPRAKLSPPKKQLVWYVEDNVPLEYRPYVEEGILEWNKAFEKIGFRNVLAVRWQEPGRDDFDPEDTNYCTFRWVTNDTTSAMSCVRANPMTGEIIDGDVIFDASWIRYWKQQYALLIGSTTSANGDVSATPLAVGEVVSPILASKMGFGFPVAMKPPGLNLLDKVPGQMVAEVIPSDQGALQWQLAKNLFRGTRGFCQRQHGFTHDFGLASIALAGGQAAPTPPASADKDKDKPKEAEKKDAKKEPEKKEEKKKPEPKDELPEDFLSQAIKETVMHEVGHSLGLRHNFKASTMLTADQLHDTSITRSKGLVASVMDYSPVNIAPKGKKQGDYYTTTIGPYDYWAIEYGYKQADGDEAGELKKIAARAPEHDLTYATDEDVILNDDPYVNRWDLGADPCQFAKDRIELAADLLKDLDSRVVKDGESWSRMRRAFSILLSQWGDAATLASQYVAGQSVSRDHKADKDARDPIDPVAGAKQRECLKFLATEILSDKPFQFSPTVLRRLGNERWMHWGNEGLFSGPGVNISVFERILGIQKIVLGHCLSPDTLSRLQNQELQANPGADPLRIDEVFRALTDGIWSDLDKIPAKDDKTAKPGLSTIRRNLQREYLRRLGGMVLGDRGGSLGDGLSFVVLLGGSNSATPADARSLARLHLKDVLGRISNALATRGAQLDDTTRAHLEECKEKISKVLEARIDSREP